MAIAVDDLLFGFRPARWAWKPLVKRMVTGSWAAMELAPGEVLFPGDLARLGLYLHVPFCRRPCPYCPYNRVKYDPVLFARYEKALHEEIELVARRFLLASSGNGNGSPRRPRIDSFYVGGGTPTLVPESLVRMIRHVQQAFGPARDTCVELHPAAMDDACLERLWDCRVKMVSIGVESLSDRLLELIGRSHDAATAAAAVRRALARGFETVNADLMFALPSQTLDDLDRDVCKLLELGTDQISAYPMFGFPYTQLGRQNGLSSVERPRGDRIRQMLRLIERRSREFGLHPCSVWSFIRPGKRKFSSVSRHHYLGFGPSAASMTGRQFYVNTFSVEAYAAALPDRLPVALVMPVDRQLEMALWVYWRAYELRICGNEFQARFGRRLEEVYRWPLMILERLGLLQKRGPTYHVTPSGAYWIHRLQNEYALSYITRLWGQCRHEPWPQRVIL